ncbi:hypothetical protein GCM10007891_05370 [Methylophaga thalassica]|uniref:Uncharacterized protein n=1 Tax=Methylophaga thalassica TaxID=40223 RepID=A0ABQ5TRQ5_9GAMM|nr:LamG-like jellyroll fold domain-containing protein [Methylophaga thalassica]GLP98683.1 hypothetical protein GCM10007891_05370 [Methylophaga thalassica]
MSVYLPDNRITVPELFYPGRKPTVPVRVNWNHPLSKGLRNILVLCSSFKNKGETPKYENGLVNFTGGTSEGNQYDVFKDVEWLKGKSEYSICIGVKPRAVDGNNMIFAMGVDSGVFRSANTIAVWVDDNEFNSGVNNCLAFEHGTATNTGPTSRVHSSENSIEANRYYNIVCRQDENSADCCINGKQDGIVITADLAPVSTSINEGYLGHLTSTLTSTINGELHYLYIFDRRLADDEVQALHINPYQFLEAA